jgi:inner membrane protein
MASFGHLAVGMMAGRLHGDGRARVDRVRCALTIVAFALLAVLPDADVITRSLGLSDWGPAGHRGASHSLLTAVAIGISGGLLARRYGASGLRTGLAITLALASHGLLDAFGQGGRAIPLLWPLSKHRFMAPWRFLPDAPRGVKFISRRGLLSAALEFVYFLPVTAFALWPRARPAAGAPALSVVEGGGGLVAPAAAPELVVVAGPTDGSPQEQRPPLRSSG